MHFSGRVAAAALALALALAFGLMAVAGEQGARQLDADTDADAAAPAVAYNCSAPAEALDTLLDYKYLVYCTPALQSSPAAARAVLLALLAVLLYLLSSTADSFFCPVLQAIVEKYRIPPDLAGVTFLTFGNGSPDVFSNIAAFSTASPSIGVTAILGGGLLVTTVIVACVGLVSEDQEQLIPRKYARDVVFYLASVIYLGVVFFDGVVHMGEAVGFLVIYFLYVMTVFLDRKLAPFCFPSWFETKLPEDLYGGVDLLDESFTSVISPSVSDSSASDGLLAGGMGSSSDSPYSQGQIWRPSDYEVFRLPLTSDSEQSDEALPYPMDLHRKQSAPTPRSGGKKFVNHQHSTASAEERQSLLERTDVVLKRPMSMCVSSIRDTRRQLRRRRGRSAWAAIESSAHLAPNARRWTRSYHQLSGIAEMPSYGDIDASELDEESPLLGNVGEEADQLPWETKSDEVFAENLARPNLSRWKRWIMLALRFVYHAFDFYVWTPFEFTTVFIRRLSIPLVDEDTWDKNFAVVCPPFAIMVFGLSVLNADLGNAWFLGTIIGLGGMLSAIVDYTASSLDPPSGWQLAPYICVGFVMSVVWIMNIASELLGVLETLGELFGISNAVLGVSVLAWGNSIGDLVSNTSIARDGFPTMAFAGCFAGPMFNLLVGIGLSVTIANSARGPVQMGKPSPLVYLGFGYLLLSLLLNLGVAAFHNFQYRSTLCYTLLVLYASFAVISIIIVASHEEE